jgi:hypothetical protein
MKFEDHHPHGSKRETEYPPLCETKDNVPCKEKDHLSSLKKIHCSLWRERNLPTLQHVGSQVF